MLYINPIGGMANRMRCIAAGVALADELNVDFKIIWLKNWELNAQFDDIFSMPTMLNGKLSYPNNFKYALLYSIPRLRNFYITDISLKRFGVHLSSEDRVYHDLKDNNNSDILIRDLFLRGFKNKNVCLLQGGTDMYQYSEELYRHIFQPNEEISEKAFERINVLGKDCYGVHIRRTDNIQSITNSPDVLFINAINDILMSNPYAKFYLASDSEEVKKTFKRKYGDIITVSSSVADRNSVDGIKEAAVEMFTLSKTKLILGSYYSSFSEAASKLGGVPLIQPTIAQ